jgi:hypothetical protein
MSLTSGWSLWEPAFAVAGSGRETAVAGLRAGGRLMVDTAELLKFWAMVMLAFKAAFSVTKRVRK